MSKKAYIAKSVVLGLVVLALVALNLELANAHRWSKWHWNKHTIKVYNFGSRTAEAKAAINDWASHTSLSLPLKNSHTDISVFGGNWGATGWWGLAQIKHHGWDWWCWWRCRVRHGHARYNSHYGGSTGTGSGSDVRGIFCQEIGHLFGLGHSNDGCMGKTYYNNSNVVVGHNASDVNSYTH